MSTTPSQSRGASSTPLDEIALAGEGLKTDTAPRIALNATATPTSQTVYGVHAPMRANMVIANLHCVVTVLGVGTAPTLIKMALVDKTGKVLGQTANLTADAMWTTTLGVKTLALVASVTIPADDVYYLSFLKNGAFATTDLALLRASMANSGQVLTIGSGTMPLNTLTSQTDFPATNSSLAWSGAGSTSAWWMAAS